MTQPTKSSHTLPVKGKKKWRGVWLVMGGGGGGGEGGGEH